MWTLIRKEWMLEMRRKHALAGVLLFVLCSVYVCYLGMEKIETTRTFGALLWITGLFTAFNALQKSFAAEGREVLMHLYQMASPRQVILSKAAYNAALVAALNAASILFFLLFFGTDAVQYTDWLQLTTGLLLGSTGLALALTFISGIAMRSGAGTGIIAVLGFPVIIPLLIAMVRHTTTALEGGAWETNALNLLVLVVLNALSLVLSTVLFPYLWRE